MYPFFFRWRYRNVAYALLASVLLNVLVLGRQWPCRRYVELSILSPWELESRWAAKGFKNNGSHRIKGCFKYIGFQEEGMKILIQSANKALTSERCDCKRSQEKGKDRERLKQIGDGVKTYPNRSE